VTGQVRTDSWDRWFPGGRRLRDHAADHETEFLVDDPPRSRRPWGGFALARSGRPDRCWSTSDRCLKAQVADIAAPAPAPTGAHSRAPDDAVRAAVARIRAAQRPVAIVGGACVPARSRRTTFVSLLGLPHASTLMALGAADPGDPHALGMLGMQGSSRPTKPCSAPSGDPLGMRFDDRVTGKPDASHACGGESTPTSTRPNSNKIIPADVTLHGDLRTRWRRWWRNSCARRFRALTPGRARRRNSAVRSRAIASRSTCSPRPMC